MPNHYTTVAICTPGHEFDSERLGALGENLCEAVQPMPPELQKVVCGKGVDPEYLRRKYGHTDWHEWAKAHWGTKWGTYRVVSLGTTGDDEPVIISFASAWGPPHRYCLEQISSMLASRFEFDRIYWVGHDPYDGSIRKLLEIIPDEHEGS